MSPQLRVRRNIRDLEKEHFKALRDGTSGPTELENLILAWKGIQELEPEHFNSFYTIGGYHGMPFRGAGWGNPSWWGGYCNHGNILFPTWHRAYVLRLEKALQSIPGCENVMMAFWDETAETGETDVIPEIFGMKTFKLTNGQEIKNPLYSYVLPKYMFDNLGSGDPQGGDYSKPKGYETVRYPLSGFASDPKTMREHNDKFKDPEENWKLLNQNVYNWLNSYITVPNKKNPKELMNIPTHTRFGYEKSLQAPNYVVFSNSTSAQEWNNRHHSRAAWAKETHPDRQPQTNPRLVVPVERPHGDIHLAVGGFNVPAQKAYLSPISGANGDMGENDTASLDPIFFFHHCEVDRMFYLWQALHGQTEEIIIPKELADFPGTNSVDAQGPTAGVAGGIWLNLDSPLAPFCKDLAEEGPMMTSRDMMSIKKLGYAYGPGSFAPFPPKPTPPAPIPPYSSVAANGGTDGGTATNGNSTSNSTVTVQPTLAATSTDQPTAPLLVVQGINRGQVAGSFVVSFWNQTGGQEQLIGHEAVFSRWHTSGCANCQTHLKVKFHVPLYGQDPETVSASDYTVKVHTHDAPNGDDPDLQKMANANKSIIAFPLSPSA